MPVEEDNPSPLPPKSPLKSALKVPGTPGRQLENPLSPTFREEQILEKREADADRDNARDLVSSTRCVWHLHATLGPFFSLVVKTPCAHLPLLTSCARACVW